MPGAQETGAPEDRPQVLRVLYAVQDNKRFSISQRLFEQEFEFRVRELRYLEGHSLVVLVARQFFQAVSVAPCHRDPPLCRKLLYLLPPGIASRKHNLVRSDLPAPQRFPDGIYTGNPDFVLGRMSLFHGMKQGMKGSGNCFQFVNFRFLIFPPESPSAEAPGLPSHIYTRAESP